VQAEHNSKFYLILLRRRLPSRAQPSKSAFKPVIALQIGDTKHYYMADSGSSTEFNVESLARGEIRYVKVSPLGERGKSLKYFDSEYFNAI
jgi:hypothetical protein